MLRCGEDVTNGVGCRRTLQWVRVGLSAALRGQQPTAMDDDRHCFRRLAASLDKRQELKLAYALRKMGVAVPQVAESVSRPSWGEGTS